jgi:hypothetical protein
VDCGACVWAGGFGTGGFACSAGRLWGLTCVKRLGIDGFFAGATVELRRGGSPIVLATINSATPAPAKAASEWVNAGNHLLNAELSFEGPGGSLSISI